MVAAARKRCARVPDGRGLKSGLKISARATGDLKSWGGLTNAANRPGKIRFKLSLPVAVTVPVAFQPISLDVILDGKP